MGSSDVAPPQGKRGALSGAAVSEEVLDSSRSVLGGTRGGLRGLQQYFTPQEAAECIKAVLDPQGRFPVLDPTAGNGALIAPWREESRFGIEIDPDQVRAGDYNALTGDLQRAFPLLLKLGVRFPLIAANPPFGLTWKDSAGKPESSTAATWRMCLALLRDEGAGAFICGADRFSREIASRDDSAGIFATVECPDLFPGVSLPCLIAFFVAPENRNDDSAGLLMEATATRAELVEPALRERLRDTLHEAAAHRPALYATGVSQSSWELVDKELARRRRAAERSRPTFDVELRAGDRLSIRPGPFLRHALAREGKLKLLEGLHNQPVGHFALNALDYRMLTELEAESSLTIAPQVKAAVVEVAAQAEREVVPLYEVRPQMRLGYLTDLDSILCTKADEERGFVAGERYPLRTDSRIDVTRGQKVTHNKEGEPIVRKYEEEAKVLVITIGEAQFSESGEDIAYLLEHFEIPDPGDIATRFPAEVERQRTVLDEIAAEARERTGSGFDWKRFQREDLARALAKTRAGGGFIHSWEQGGGKTLGAAGYALGAVRSGARNQVLFIVPQDLIPQYRRDISEKLGIEMEHIQSPAQARAVAAHLKAGGDGWYITHYEALSLLGVKNEALPEKITRIRDAAGEIVTLSSGDFCPACAASYDDGWQKDSPLVCSARHEDPHTGRERTCGYVHKRLRVKSAGHHLAGAFAEGVICIDEGTLIKGNDSQRSKAIRGLRARNRLLATGTPISNYVNQIFWLMWWCLGDASLRFPYSYEGGLAAFESDFCVVEYTYGCQSSETEHRRERRRVLPQITNVSRFWRLSASAMIRRRKRDFGEPLVPCTLRTVRVPMGVAQQRLYAHWLDKGRFASFFAWKYPQHPLVKSGQIERFAAACGQLTKLEYATTVPEAATDREWPTLQDFEHSNWTPKNVKTLELIVEHVRAGEKVLVGSDLIETGRWLCDRLVERRVRAAHIVEEKNGKPATVNPRKRAKVMHEFRHGDLEVLLCGIPAIRLGHNLDTASIVVVNGLVFSYEMFDQFIARAHRLSSKKPVTVYVMLAKGSLDEQKWELLCAKSAAADLALDGQLMDEREEPISLEKVLKEMQERGVAVTGEEVAEAELEAAWRSLSTVAPAAPEHEHEPVPVWEDTEQLHLFAA